MRLLLIGRIAYNVSIPADPAALALTIVVGVFTFAALGICASGLIPNQEAAGPVLSIVFFVLLYLSGLWFPLHPGSALARISAWFPVRHLIIATFAPYDPRPHANAFAWHDLLIMVHLGCDRKRGRGAPLPVGAAPQLSRTAAVSSPARAGSSGAGAARAH